MGGNASKPKEFSGDILKLLNEYPSITEAFRVISEQLFFSKEVIFCFVFIVIYAVSLFRTSVPNPSYLDITINVLQIVAFVYYTHLITNYLISSGSNDIYFCAIVIFSSFIVLNLILYMIFGAQDRLDLGEPLMLNTWFGINLTHRVFFPLVGGFNSYGVTVGALMAMTIVGLFTIPSTLHKTILFFLFVIDFIVMLLIDNRGGMFLGILVPIFIFLLTRFSLLEVLKYLVYIVPFIPILFLMILPLIGDSGIMSDISRSNSELQTANSRVIIWGIALQEFIDFKAMHLWGYGELGQYGSGASQGWAKILTAFENPEYVHVHDLLLQMIFDLGYIGALVFLTVFGLSINVCLKLYNRIKDARVLVFITFLVYLVSIGVIESLYTYKSFLYLMLFTFTVIYAVYNNHLNDMRQQIIPKIK